MKFDSKEDAQVTIDLIEIFRSLDIEFRLYTTQSINLPMAINHIDVSYYILGENNE